MNVFELPANGGGFVFGSAWGIADLVASFDDGGDGEVEGDEYGEERVDRYRNRL